MTLFRALAVLVGLAAAGFIGFGLGVGLGRDWMADWRPDPSDEAGAQMGHRRNRRQYTDRERISAMLREAEKAARKEAEAKPEAGA